MKSDAAIKLTQSGQELHCAGAWTLAGMKTMPVTLTPLIKGVAQQVQINVTDITQLDTVGAFRLRRLMSLLERAGKKVTLVGMQKNHQLIFDLVQEKYPAIHPAKVRVHEPHWLEIVGRWAVAKSETAVQFFAFFGETLFHLFRLNIRGIKSVWKSGLKIIQTAGCDALPIVGLMSFLVGIVLAYQLGVQLKVYGADIYVVDATGIAILREFAPLMTSVIIAGRTSTAFAALIGTMKVNDELDALATMGISPIERLVIPRIAGLLIALPLLVVWSMFFSVLGSMVMTKVQSGISYIAFMDRFKVAVSLSQYVLGMVKTPVFAFIIAIVGCFQGFQAGITADSVGLKTTAAAVQAIFLIIIADAFFSVLYSWCNL